MSNAGSYQVIVTNAYGAVTSSVATLTVTRVNSIITWAPPTAITYGTPLGGAQLDASANVPGTFAYAPASGAIPNAGVNSLSVVFTPSDIADYIPTTVSLTVLPVTLTVTAANASRAFGGINPKFTGTIVGLQNSDNITAAYNCSASQSSPVGMYPIVPSLVDPNNRETNYNVVSLVDGELTVGTTVSSNDPALRRAVLSGGGGATQFAGATGQGTNGSAIFSLAAAGGPATAVLYASLPPLPNRLRSSEPACIGSTRAAFLASRKSLRKAPASGNGSVNTIYSSGTSGPLFAGSGLATDGSAL